MVNVNSKSAARRRVREAQARANEERAQRERDNVEDAATMVVERGRVVGVDAWEAERRDQVQAEADRRRDEHRMVAAAAAARMQQRGENVAGIAALTDSTVTEVRALLKLLARRDAGTPTATSQPPRAVSDGTVASQPLGGGDVTLPAGSDALGRCLDPADGM